MVNNAPIEISQRKNSSVSVILLHGLGSDGNDFAPIIEMLNLPNIRFILPHAPYRKVTANNGYEMRAWYDLFGLSAVSPQDETGIRETQAYIESLIAQENQRGIPNDKIVLAGFSQGGAMALHTALRQQQPLAGVLALSTYLPLRSLLASEKNQANQNTPIFMAHGTYDTVISLATCHISLEALLAAQYRVEWHEYAMAHSICAEEIDDIRAFLSHIFTE
ncbi:MAG: alpha/beta hydrolase [Methylophilaceae bacterium]